MAIKKTQRTTKSGVKTRVTSTYFDDVRMIRQSKMDSKQSIYDLRKEAAKERTTVQFDVGGLQVAWAAQELKLWRMGCRELSEWARTQSPNALDGVTTVYMGEDWEELLAKDEREEKFAKGEMV
jgi:hypothetical protein